MKRIPISLSEETRQHLRKQSEETGLSIAEYIRILIETQKVKLDIKAEYPLEIWRKIVKARDKYRCFNCGLKLTKDTTEAHHIKRKEDGGKNTLINGLTACRPCHRLIHNQLKDIYTNNPQNN